MPLHGDAAGLEQRHLLDLGVLEGGGAGQRVEVVVVQRLLGHPAGVVGLGRGHHHHALRPRGRRAVDVAGHEQDARVGEPGAAAVVERHPRLQIGPPPLAVELQDVVGRPRDAAGQVGGGQLGAAAGAAVETPDQGRTRPQVGRQRRQRDPSRHLEDDLAAHLEDRPGRHAEQPSLDPLAVLLDPAHRLADVLLEDLLAREQVEFVVLLQQAQRAPAGGLDQERPRLDLRRHVPELQRRDAARQLHRAHLAHQGQVLVVDGDVERAPAGGLGDDDRRPVRRFGRS